MDEILILIEEKVKESGNYVIITKDNLIALLQIVNSSDRNESFESVEVMSQRFVDVSISSIKKYGIKPKNIREKSGASLANIYNFINRKKPFGRKFRNKLRTAILEIVSEMDKP